MHTTDFRSSVLISCPHLGVHFTHGACLVKRSVLGCSLRKTLASFKVHCAVVIDLSAGSPFASLITEVLAATWRSDAGSCSICCHLVGTAVFRSFRNWCHRSQLFLLCPSLPESLALKKVTALISLVLRRHHVCHSPGVKKSSLFTVGVKLIAKFNVSSSF